MISGTTVNTGSKESENETEASNCYRHYYTQNFVKHGDHDGFLLFCKALFVLKNILEGCESNLFDDLSTVRAPGLSYKKHVPHRFRARQMSFGKL